MFEVTSNSVNDVYEFQLYILIFMNQWEEQQCAIHGLQLHVINIREWEEQQCANFFKYKFLQFPPSA